MESLARRTHVVLTAAALVALALVVLGLSGAVFPGPSAGPSEATEEPPAAELPMLELKITGPERASVGSKVTFELVVTNVGKKAAKDLLVIDRFDPGLEHAAAASPIEHDLAELAPGKAQRLSLTLRVAQPGLLAHAAEVTSGGRLVVSARASVRAVAPAGAPSEGSPATTPAGGKSAIAGPAAKPKPQIEPGAEAKAEPKPAPGSVFPEIPFRKTSPEEEEQEKIPELGPPLVDQPENLKRLHPQYPVWIDRRQNRVVVMGGVCLRQAPLELFACIRGSKEHESIVTIPTKASFVHAALLAVGAEPGAPAQFQPTYVPASGTEIEVTLAWKDGKGERKTARAQEWIRDVKTRKAMEHPWVFAGSGFFTNPVTKQIAYRADLAGDLICVSNFPDAMLDLPIPSSAANAELLFEAFTERIPPVGTPVTVILTPKPKKPAEPDAKSAKPEPKPTSSSKAVRPAERAVLPPKKAPAANTPAKQQ